MAEGLELFSCQVHLTWSCRNSFFFTNLLVFAQIYLWGLLADYLSWTVRNSLCIAYAASSCPDIRNCCCQNSRTLIKLQLFWKVDNHYWHMKYFYIMSATKVIHWGTSGESAACAAQIVHKWAMQFIFVVTSGLQLALLAMISDFHQATCHMHGKKSFRAFCIRKKACRFLKMQIFLGQHSVLPNTVHYNSELMFLLPLSHYIFLQPPNI